MDDVDSKIENDPDFINIKRFDYSLERLLERYPEGAPMKVICQALNMSEKEVEDLYANVVEKLKAKLAY